MDKAGAIMYAGLAKDGTMVNDGLEVRFRAELGRHESSKTG